MNIQEGKELHFYEEVEAFSIYAYVFESMVSMYI